MKLTYTNIMMLVIASFSIATISYAKTNYPISNEQQKLAKEVSQKGIALKYIKKNAPSHYVVKIHDTLWGISGKFLTKPSLWPALWGANKSKIINPHLIYPGQHLYLIKKNGYAYLSTSPDGNNQTIKLRPKIRTGEMEKAAIPAIPERILKAFVVEPKVLDITQINNSSRVISGEPHNKLNFGQGDILYVKGNEQGHSLMQVFKKPIPIYNPNPINKDSKEKEIIAFEADYVADIKKINNTNSSVNETEVNTFKIVKSNKEIDVGDIVLPEQIKPSYDLQPEPAPDNIHAFVAKVYGGSDFGAKGFVVVVNKGQNHGLKAGHVLQIVKRGATIVDKTNALNPKDKVKLPNRAVGFALVFATHPTISYAFISDSDEEISLGDFLVSEGDAVD